jgi:hypothetical protein
MDIQTIEKPAVKAMEPQSLMDIAERHHKPLTIGLVWFFHIFSSCVLDVHKSYTVISFIFALIFTVFFGFLGVMVINWMEVVKNVGEIVKVCAEAAATVVSIYTVYTLAKKTHGRKRRTRR